MNYILDYPPVILALLATMFTWLMTALGASIVLFVGMLTGNFSMLHWDLLQGYDGCQLLVFTSPCHRTV
jgi:zinc transporter ZupT